jgi:hypothetical protein
MPAMLTVQSATRTSKCLPSQTLTMREAEIYKQIGYPVFRWYPSVLSNNIAGRAGSPTLTGSPVLDSGGYLFDTVAKYATYPSAGILNTAQGTFLIDYTPTDATSVSTRAPGGCIDGSGNGFLISVRNAANNNKLSIFWNSATANLESGNLTWTAGQRYQLALTWSGTTVTIYRDAVSQATNAISALATYPALIYFGANNPATVTALGKIPKALIFDKALNAAQLAALV